MGAGAQARVVQDVQHVHAPGHGAVDEVLALAVAVHAPGDGHLVEIDRQRAVGIVEHEIDLGETGGLARRGAGEDDVLHGLAAQVLRQLRFPAEHPQNGVSRCSTARPAGPTTAVMPGSSVSALRSAKDLKPLRTRDFRYMGA